VKRLFYQLAILFLFSLAGCGTADEKGEHQQPDTTTLAPGQPLLLEDPEGMADSDTQLTGLLQSSGLQPQEARALGIPDAHYQLITQKAYFLQGSDSLQYYQGQCVTLIGRMAEGWEEHPDHMDGQTTYGRGLFRVERIKVQPFSFCHSSDTTASAPRGRQVRYRGTVAHRQRPAPDIAYDYALQLQKPYRDDNHPIEPGMLVRSLPLVTAEFEVLSRLENAILTGESVEIEGVQHQGYAEQQAVWIIRLNSQNL
jgi:predicted small lipoprotein YifL